MDRVGFGRVGICRTSAATTSQQILLSANNAPSTAGCASSRLSVSLPTVFIDRVPNRLGLRALRPRDRGEGRSRLRRRKRLIIRPVSSSVTAVSSSPDPSNVSCSSAADRSTLGGDDHGEGQGKLNPAESSRTVGARVGVKTGTRPRRVYSRRKRNSSSGGDSRNGSGGGTECRGRRSSELKRLAESLESAYHKDATTSEEDYEKILKDLEAQTREAQAGERPADGGAGDEEEHQWQQGGVSSSSSPTISSFRKRRAKRQPNDASLLQVASQQQQQLPSVISPRRTKDGFIVRPISASRCGEGGGGGGGKIRLNLNSRIALRKRRQEGGTAGAATTGLKVVDGDANAGKAALDIWSEEAEKLIAQHGAALDLGVVDWDRLKKGLLSADEEAELAFLMIPMKNFENVRKSLAKDLGRESAEEEWAAAAQVDVHTLRRHLHLGKAARNKLIQHNLRLVLFQAHKYHRESSSLSLFDLCQEGVSGLLHGVDKFDPTRGHRFSTYAIYWVRNSILRAQTRSGSSLRSPYNVALHKLNIKRARLDLLVELERAPTNQEVMARLGLTPERFRNILQSASRTASMHRKSTITGEELIDTYEDKFSSGRNQPWDDESLRFGVDDVLDSLKPREGQVLRQRFGLDGNGERTLGEIGQTMGLSREMVRKYEACALMKMRHPTRMDFLRSYLS